MRSDGSNTGTYEHMKFKCYVRKYAKADLDVSVSFFLVLAKPFRYADPRMQYNIVLYCIRNIV